MVGVYAFSVSNVSGFPDSSVAPLFETLRSCATTSILYVTHLVWHLSGLSASTDILRLLSHYYRYSWTPRLKGLDVPMDNILRNAGQSEEQEGCHEHRDQSPSSFRKVLLLVLRAENRTTPR